MTSPHASAEPYTPDTSDEAAADAAGVSRRESLKAIGRFAAYTAPAMSVLLSVPADAAPNCDNPGNHFGFGKGRGNQHSPC